MRNAAVITVSDRAAAGARTDTAGPVAVAALREAGFACPPARVVPDGAEQVAAAIRAAVADGARLVVTTGGTGIGPRDRTPEGTRLVVEREVPGLAERIRAIGAARVPAAVLSRGVSGVTGAALVVNLPGSAAAVTDGIAVILQIAPHALDQLDGGDHR